MSDKRAHHQTGDPFLQPLKRSLLAVAEILRAAERGTYDLIVIGAPEPRRLLTRLALGRIGPQLLTSARESVFIARTDPQPQDSA